MVPSRYEYARAICFEYPLLPNGCLISGHWEKFTAPARGAARFLQFSAPFCVEEGRNADSILIFERGPEFGS